MDAEGMEACGSKAGKTIYAWWTKDDWSQIKYLQRSRPGWSTEGDLAEYNLGFSNCKKQKLVLLRKEDKSLNRTSSYRPICLLDFIEKLLEGLIFQRLDRYMTGDHSLSQKQFGFRKGHSTVYAIQVVVGMTTKARRNSGRLKKKGSALSSLEVYAKPSTGKIAWRIKRAKVFHHIKYACSTTIWVMNRWSTM